MPVCLCAEQLTETSESWHLTTKQIFKLGFSTSITIITTKIGKEENSNCSCLVISPWWFYIMLFLQPVMYITKWNVAAPVNLLRRHRPRFCEKNSEIEIDFMSNSNQKKIGRLLGHFQTWTYILGQAHLQTSNAKKRKLECKSSAKLRISTQTDHKASQVKKHPAGKVPYKKLYDSVK